MHWIPHSQVQPVERCPQEATAKGRSLVGCDGLVPVRSAEFQTDLSCSQFTPMIKPVHIETVNHATFPLHITAHSTDRGRPLVEGVESGTAVGNCHRLCLVMSTCCSR
jgi:hypothetical protein